MHGIVGAAASALAMVVAAVPADAAVITYDVSGSFADGRTLSGSFDVDDNGTGYFDQLKDIDLTVSGVGLFDMADAASYAGPTTSTGRFALYFADSATYSMMLGLQFVAAHDGFKILSIADQPFASGTTYFGSNGAQVALVSGGIASRAVVAVPEPDIWAMMLLGFGMVGATARYRRRSVATAYA